MGRVPGFDTLLAGGSRTSAPNCGVKMSAEVSGAVFGRRLQSGAVEGRGNASDAIGRVPGTGTLLVGGSRIIAPNCGVKTSADVFGAGRLVGSSTLQSDKSAGFRASRCGCAGRTRIRANRLHVSSDGAISRDAGAIISVVKLNGSRPVGRSLPE